MKRIPNLKDKLNQKIRDKAISRAKTRIVLAGKVPEDFNEEQLEVIVKEEEEKILSGAKEKGLLVLASLLGLSLWG
ncbi:hypothetical protein KO505_06900 [Psychrosphaera sp. F3M07]|jgi:hypothetical protein|uniref:Uncharacterized protein n=1 Tax=Psychrosphaera aquimarina TaxID=2044854 RepID=A0ABU3R534_9GAMM|nr:MULTISPECIES: hypothetical protein [Psychrosphaera]MBU2917688.1 hypothetical protein [Psychrosphaera sp. F3M07]MDU0114780.1 hypothetical protein [Psychrosphaera aquimarina]